jgi:hypothetical protein
VAGTVNEIPVSIKCAEFLDFLRMGELAKNSALMQVSEAFNLHY